MESSPKIAVLTHLFHKVYMEAYVSKPVYTLATNLLIHQRSALETIFSPRSGSIPRKSKNCKFYKMAEIVYSCKVLRMISLYSNLF